MANNGTTVTVKVKDERMAAHLDSKQNKSGYIRDVIRSDMITRADEIKDEIQKVEQKRQEMQEELEELKEQKTKLRTELSDAQDVADDMGTSLLDFAGHLVSIEPDMREQNIRNRIKAEVPEVSEQQMLDAVENVGLHYYGPDGELSGPQIDEDLARNFDDISDVKNALGMMQVPDDRPEMKEYAAGLNQRERQELRDFFNL
jgi:chromosome segregation ATPase